MFGDTVKKFVLWNTFRKETSRDLDEIAVYISIEAWKADWAKAKSLEDEPFKSQFEQIRQVVCMALAQAKHSGFQLKYTVARPTKFWDDVNQVGYRYEWTYDELDEMRSTIEWWDNSSDRSPTTLVVVTDHDAMWKELDKTKSPSIISIIYPRIPQTQMKATNQGRSGISGTIAAWLENMPKVAYTHRAYFEWENLYGNRESDLELDNGPDAVEEEEIAVPSIKEGEISPPAKKRKRQEETDDYLSFVERTMAAYKKL